MFRKNKAGSGSATLQETKYYQLVLVSLNCRWKKISFPFSRNRLKYALTMKEVHTIVKQRLVKIDGQVRTDARFPTGFMDVIQIEKTGENFRIIYDVKGRFIVHRITAQEAKYKLCKVRGVSAWGLHQLYFKIR